MKFTNAESAEVLVGALPYIEKYAGKTIVVKYGGNAMKSEELKLAVMHDIVLLRLIGVNVVLVHGGGPEISAMMERLGKKSKFIRGLRVTDSETADIVQMVTNKINKRLVNMIGAIGGTARRAFRHRRPHDPLLHARSRAWLRRQDRADQDGGHYRSA